MAGVKASGSGAAIGHGTHVPDMNLDYTHVMFVKPITSVSEFAAIHEIIEQIGGGFFGDAHDLGAIEWDVLNAPRLQIENLNNDGDNPEFPDFSNAIPAEEWAFVAVVRRGTALEMWYAPADGETAPTIVAETEFGDPADLSGRRDAKRLWVGAFSYINQYNDLTDFSVTGRKFWQAALTEEELRVESLQKHPVKTEDLWASWLTKHKDDLEDYSGNGRPWNWAKDAAQTPVDPGDPDIGTDPDDSIDEDVPDGEFGENPEEGGGEPLIAVEDPMRNYRFVQPAREGFDVITHQTGGTEFWYRGGTIVDSNGAVVAVDPGRLTLDGGVPNYIERDADGVVSANTTSFTSGSTPLYYVTMVDGEMDTIRDMRV